MEAYSDFAKVYDTFMDETPYSEWCEYIISLLKAYNITDGLVPELLASAGYDMIGVDNSSQMLTIAMEKKDLAKKNILYLMQDMREFELYGTIKAVVSVCDSLNYLLESEDLVKTFQLVNNYLDPKGIFIFDFNTVFKYETIIGDAVIAENREECSFIWENYYHLEEQINEYDLTIFAKEGDLYRKFTETHYQRGYSLEEMIKIIEASGLELMASYDAFTRNEPTDTSERIYIICRENGK